MKVQLQVQVQVQVGVQVQVQVLVQVQVAPAARAGAQLRITHDGGGVERHRLGLCLLAVGQLVAVHAVDLQVAGGR